MPSLENRGPQLQVVAIVFVTMAIFSFTMRAFVRAKMVKGFGLDDWLMASATLTFSTYIACVLGGVHYGTGRHFTDIALPDAEKALEVCRDCDQQKSGL